MKIAVDAMGGDFAPRNPVAGAVLAARELGAEVVLVGRRDEVEAELGSHEVPASVEVVHAEEVVGMDESPATALRRKKKSSIHVAAGLLREGEVHGLVSAGNTGAIMVIVKLLVGTVGGVDRPALAIILPNRQGRTVLVDVGANVDPKSEHLVQFAVMGTLYATQILGVERPRVGLLSIGEEAGKGTDLIREAHKALAASPLNFMGNVEGRDIYSGAADVVVCDGFTGNVVLKTSEAVVETMLHLLRDELVSSRRSRLAAWLARPTLMRYRDRVHYEEFGGAPLLGARGLAVICHGRSSPVAIRNGVRVALEYGRSNVGDRIEAALAELSPRDGAVAPAVSS